MHFCYPKPSLQRLYTFLAFSILFLAPENAFPLDERQPALTTADRVVLCAIFGDRHIADNALVVHQRASRMPVEERYEYLSAWVLPGPDHMTIRTSLDFTPTNPAPPVRGEELSDVGRLQIARRSGHSRVQIGGRLVAPALDLVEVAKQLGQLEEVRDRVDRVAPSNDEQRRSRLSLLVAVDVARGDFDAASDGLTRLFSLAKSDEQSEFQNYWPEMLAIRAAVQHPEVHEIVQNVGFRLVLHHVRPVYHSVDEAWPFQLLALLGLSTHLDPKSDGESIEEYGLAPSLKQWAPAPDVTARSRGTGRPQPHWRSTPGSIEKLSGHGADSLYFQSPLHGNYSVECETSAIPWGDSHVLAGGMWVASLANLKSYRLGTVRGEHRLRDIAPKLAKPVRWNFLRTVIRDGVSRTYVNGRQIHEELLPTDHVPWLAIHSYIRRNGATRNLRISGDPVIPDQLQLAAAENLSGWISYFDESVGHATADWRPLDDASDGGGIIGMRRAAAGQVSKRSGDRPAAIHWESLLQYHRPMLEDGEIEYEFYYQKDESHTHPALDRLAFMLQPSGVRIHWITDSKHDRTDLDPANISDEPQNRRGSGPLPLKVDSWNRLNLSLVGNVVQLTLNGKEVYKRELEATNQRTFGLFHYSDRTAARVRNIVWRGDWPRELPSVEEQELAGERADFLDKDIAQLTAVFEHDFSSLGLLADRFKLLEEGWQPFVIEQPDGLHVTRPGVKDRFLNYTIAPRCTIQGDFDVTVSFENFEPEPAKGTAETKCCLLLSAALNDEAQTRAYLNRRHVRQANRDDDQLVEGSFTRLVKNQTRRSVFDVITCEAHAGTLRLARRGSRMYFLVAEEDSSFYRLIGEETFSGADLHDGGIRMHTMTYGPGTTKVVWKKMTIRATGIMGLPLDNQ